MRPERPQLSRRTLLLAGLGTATLAACGSGDDAADSGAPSIDLQPSAGLPLLVPGFPSGLRGAPSVFIPGQQQRAPVFLVDDVGRPLLPDDMPDRLELDLSRDGEVLNAVTAPLRREGIPTGLYPILFSVDEPGIYRFDTEVAGTALNLELVVEDPAEIAIVHPGDQMRPVDTPTFDDARGVDGICTRFEGPCPFHEVTLTEALAGGAPTVFIVSTPAYCQTAICGPVLEILIDAVAAYPDLQVVHAEPWISQEQILLPDGLTAAMTTYALDYEPSLMVADAAGIVTARLDWGWDRSETEAALVTSGA